MGKPLSRKEITLRNDKLLHIYLQDHLAGASAGVEVAKRCLSKNEEGALGQHLRQLIQEIAKDKRALESFMDDVGAPKAPWKQGAAWLAEKVGRLKLNGQMRGYSPLSRLEELEGLCLGIEGKLSMWRSLKHASRSWGRMRDFDFDTYIERASAQRRELESFRRDAAAEALGGAA